MADSLLRVDLEIDRVVHQFEQALRGGEPVRIEDCAERHSALGSRLIRELLLTEIEFRRSQQLPIHWDEYSVRFPEIVPELRTQLTRVALEGTETHQILGKDSSVVDSSDEPLKVADEPPLTPLDLSDYHLQNLLGGGGQGDVYLATQRSLGRQVAIKLLKKSSAHHPQSELRFLREARTLAQTSHPQIVTIHGIGRTAENELFLVMEHIEGRDLAKQIADRACHPSGSPNAPRKLV